MAKSENRESRIEEENGQGAIPLVTDALSHRQFWWLAVRACHSAIVLPLRTVQYIIVLLFI